MGFTLPADHRSSPAALAPRADARDVIGLVPGNRIGAASMMNLYPIEQGFELRGLVCLPGGDADGQRHAFVISHQMKLAAATPS